MDAENWREEDLDILRNTDGVDKEDVRRLVEEYRYPGEIYQDLYYSAIDLDVELDLGKDELLHEMSRAGMTFYTGKPEPELSDPPDVYEYTGPDIDRIRYHFFGREKETPLCHFYRGTDEQKLEILVFEQDIDGSLDRQGLDKFGHSPVSRLQNYIEEREWDLLRKPDYTQLREQLVVEKQSGITDPVDADGQSTWSDWSL